MPEAWQLRGEYMENCNCAVLCPCLLGPRNAKGGPAAQPTEGTCDVPVVFRIESGRHGAVALDGTHVGLIVHTPGPMGEGNWTAGLYLDRAASAEQRAALETIFTGRAGGPMAFVAGNVTTWLPVRTAPIEFGKDGRRRWARIPGMLDMEIEGIEGRDGAETWIDNVRHFVASRLAAARATRSSYKDHGHYAAFAWASR